MANVNEIFSPLTIMGVNIKSTFANKFKAYKEKILQFFWEMYSKQDEIFSPSGRGL